MSSPARGRRANGRDERPRRTRSCASTSAASGAAMSPSTPTRNWWRRPAARSPRRWRPAPSRVVARVHRWPRGMPQYVLGSLERLAVIERRLAEHPGLAVAGAAYRGVGIPDCIASGEQAAERVARRPARAGARRVDPAPDRDARVATGDGAGAHGGGRAARARSRGRDRAALHPGRPRCAPHVRGDRRARHLRERARGGAVRRSHRRGRALRQGSHRRRRRRPVPCRLPGAGRPARCLGRPGRVVGRGPGWARASQPRRYGASRNSCASGPTCRSNLSAATSRPASGSAPNAASTPSSWRPPASTASISPTRSAFASRPTRCRPNPARGSSPCRSAQVRSPSWPAPTIPIPRSRCVPNAPSRAPSPAAARCRSRPTPRGSQTADGACSRTPIATASSRSSRPKGRSDGAGGPACSQRSWDAVLCAIGGRGLESCFPVRRCRRGQAKGLDHRPTIAALIPSVSACGRPRRGRTAL